jgi:hypothetical protein
MTISVITLRKVFDDIFSGKNTIDYNAICAMIDVEDTFNAKAYSLDETFLDATTAQNHYECNLGPDGKIDGFVLYSKSIGSGGKNVWTSIANPDARIPSSVDLYLKTMAPNGRESYVQIYSLKQLNPDRFFSDIVPSEYLPYYADIAARVAGTMYALCCYQKKLMELHIQDIGAINREQMEINRVLAHLASIKNDLTEKDINVIATSEKNFSTVYASILAFLAQRGLINKMQGGKGITNEIIKDLHRHIVGDDVFDIHSISDPTINILDFIKVHEADFKLLYEGTALEKMQTACDLIAAKFNTPADSDLKQKADLYFPCITSGGWPKKYDAVTSAVSENIGDYDPVRIIGVIKELFYTDKVAAELKGKDLSIFHSEIDSPHQEYHIYTDIFSWNGTDKYLHHDAYDFWDANSAYWTADNVDLAGRLNAIIWTMKQSESYVNFTYEPESGIGTQTIGGTSYAKVSSKIKMLKCIKDIIGGNAKNGTITELETILKGSGPADELAMLKTLREAFADSFATSYIVKKSDVASGYTQNLVDSFRAWTQLQTLFLHYDMFFDKKGGSVDRANVESATLAELNLNVYHPVYWKRAFEAEGCSFRGTIGIGDHWVFDPRVRDKNGQIRDNNYGKGIWDGKSAKDCLYFDGFGFINTGTNYEDNGKINNAIPTNLPAEVWSPDYSVSWFGNNPPSGAMDFEIGIAGILSRNYGDTHFMPIDNDYYHLFDANAAGQAVFGEKFKDALASSSTELITIRNKLNKEAAATSPAKDLPLYFYISDFAGFSLGKWDDTIADQFLSDYRKAMGQSGKDYWQMPQNTDNTSKYAYTDMLKGTIDEIANGITVTGDSCSFFEDTVRIYMDQINSTSTTRLTAMQMSLQMSQQNLNVATNLPKSMFKARTEITGSIR